MADIEAAAPPFTHLLKTEAVPESDMVNVYVGTADRTGYKFAISAAIIPALMMELRGRMSQLRPADDQQVATAAMKPSGIKLAIGGDGQPALILSMGGYDAALSMDLATVRLLYDGMGQLLRRN